MLLRLAPAGIVSALVFSSLFQSIPALATSIDWGGKYRFELVDIENPSLLDSNPHKNKAYWLHYAELRPTILASDSLRIQGKLLLLSNSLAFRNELGSFMGVGSAPANATAADEGTSNVWSGDQAISTVGLSELFMTWEQEHGALIVGRAPLQFGIGMQYSAGRGLFDHWSDTRDVVGYKVVSGNIFLMPMFTNVNENMPGTGADDIREQIFQFGYKNPDSKLELGLIYVSRFANAVDASAGATSGGNDAPANPISGGVAGAAAVSRWNVTDINISASQKGEDYYYGFEFGFRNGDTGVQANGSDIAVESFGFAAELGYTPSGGDWSYHFQTGYATGDDSNTNDKFEGYVFDRNYDVGFLMFNHPLGNSAFNSGIHRLTQNTNTRTEDLIDEDAFTNGSFLAPSIKWRASDNFDLEFKYIMASLNKEIMTGAGTSLGSEFDFSMIYRPYRNMEWITTFGYFSPGDAFAGGANAFDKKTTYGLTTKAAISF